MSTTNNTTPGTPGTPEPRKPLDAQSIGALVTLVTLRNVAFSEGTPEQFRRYQEARNPKTDNPDVLDLRSVGTLSALEGMASGLTEEDNLKLAYSAVYKSLYQMRAVKLSRRSMQTVYIDDPDTGDISAVNDDIRDLVKELDTNTALAAILSGLTPRQRDIVRLSATGLSDAQIAVKLHVSQAYVCKARTAIRAHANKLYPDGVSSIL